MDRCAAERMTSAITSVADRETPHWQLQQERVSYAGKRMSSYNDDTHCTSTPSPRTSA